MFSTRYKSSKLVGRCIETNISNKHNMVGNPNWQEADQLAIYRAFLIYKESNSGIPRTNPASGRVEDLNPGPPD